MFKNIILIIQIIIAILLTLTILVQSKGTGLSKAWGMSGGTSFARRGLEKVIFRSTFFLAVIFIIVSIIQVL